MWKPNHVFADSQTLWSSSLSRVENGAKRPNGEWPYFQQQSEQNKDQHQNLLTYMLHLVTSGYSIYVYLLADVVDCSDPLLWSPESFSSDRDHSAVVFM